MYTFELVIVALLALFLMLPVAWLWNLSLLYWRRSGPEPFIESYVPHVAVILSLRGADPTLAQCIRGLLRQNYPNYSVWIVIDSLIDPAWGIIPQILAEGQAPRVKVHVLHLSKRRQSCSLKMSSQLQAISSMNGEFDVVATIDADCVPDEDWLRLLVAPLADESVGAATGIRWFAPQDDGWGSEVRYLFNAASSAQMVAFRIPWGGSLAIHARVLLRSNLLDYWSACFCEDTSVQLALRKCGLSLAFVPELTQVNRESITLAHCYRFILRQLLCVRLHHQRWSAILTANTGTFLAQVICLGLSIVGLFTQNWAWAAVGSGLLLLHVVGTASGLALGEYFIRRLLQRRGDDYSTSRTTWKIIPAAILTQVLGIYCMIATIYLRTIDWRGVAYRIFGPDEIQLLKYRPFSPLAQPGDSRHSIV